MDTIEKYKNGTLKNGWLDQREGESVEENAERSKRVDAEYRVKHNQRRQGETDQQAISRGHTGSKSHPRG